MKIYLARHQATGVLWEHPFASPPSDEQLAALAKLCFQQHGETHPKTKKPYWLKVVEVDVLDKSTVPVVPERALSTVNVAGLAEAKVEATGHVKNP
jgi:hypothetical protein